MSVFPTEGMEMTRLLVVSDVAASRQWYEGVLGARVDREYESACVLSMLGGWILLVAGGGPTEDKPTVALAPPADADRVSAELIFRVRDCRGVYETLRTRGADFLTPPVDRGYEIRAFFRDPDGHLFEISELVG
ncbi:VOC family protein [Streptomyces sp. NPDC050485]|uniref:VOC family protein n=1 Tax=Streptomyces sp. NPDC050485 TaxID=3365617 RepID=UPI00378E3FB3